MRNDKMNIEHTAHAHIYGIHNMQIRVDRDHFMIEIFGGTLFW